MFGKDSEARFVFDEDYTIRSAFNSIEPVSSYDPTRIYSHKHAYVVKSVYGTLLQYDFDGGLEPGLAESFHWDGETLILTLRPYKTVDGFEVTAEDAALSLTRLIVLGKNTHGDLGMLMCKSSRPKTIKEPCKGIAYNERTLKLTVEQPEYKPFLLKLLPSVDFGIVPKRSFSHDTLQITDHRNTTGVYFIVGQRDDGGITLERNPHHWLAQTSMPKRIETVPIHTFSEALAALQKGEIDHITSPLNEFSNMLPELTRAPGLQSIESKSIHAFKTMPIKKTLLATTYSQLSNLTAAERHFVYSSFRKAYLEQSINQGQLAALDFFPALGEGSLTDFQLQQIRELNKINSAYRPKRKVSIGVSRRRMEQIKPIFDQLDFAEIVEIKTVPGALPLNERPDFALIFTDSAFFESLSLISYNSNLETSLIPKSELEAWLDQYIQLDKSERIDRLRNLNFQNLKEGIFGVIAEDPYLEITRHPYVYEASPFFGTADWQSLRKLK